jgi:hypothetical protein
VKLNSIPSHGASQKSICLCHMNVPDFVHSVMCSFMTEGRSFLVTTVFFEVCQ